MANIGFTTGSLYQSTIPFDERIKLYRSLGADAIELSFATPTELFAYRLSEQAIKDIKNFKFVSIHAPSDEVKYGANPATQKIIERLRFLCDKLPIAGIVLHPDVIDDFEILDQSGLPFLLENMDRRKSYGTHPKQFQELKRKYGFGFVLDLEHAYEQDSSMQLAREFIDVMGDRLKHLHVSGCNESEIHVPACCAVNKDAISKILKLNINVPKILEGVLLKNVQDSIISELNYIRNFERN